MLFTFVDSSDAGQQTVGKGRKQAHYKSRTGCVTCKRRRIKCDETIPSCLRCAGSKFKCEGYDIVKPWIFEPTRGSKATTQHHERTWQKEQVKELRGEQKEKVPRSARELADVDRHRDIQTDRTRIPCQVAIWCLTTGEAEALRFFHAKTKLVLQGYSSSACEVFTRIIPQLAMTDYGIRQQLIALGSAHEHHLNGNASLLPLALKSHGLALKQMSSCSEPHLILVSCLLFMTMEMLLDQTKNALAHLRYGTEVLKSFRGQSGLIAHLVAPIFAQLCATASFVPEANVGINHEIKWQTPEVPHIFANLYDARCKYFEISVWSYFQPSTKQTITKIQKLRRSYKRSLANLQATLVGTDRQSLQAKLMAVRDELYVISTHCQSEADELAWDLHIDKLEQQLMVCKQVCYSAKAYNIDELVEDDFEILPGIFPIALQIAMSCRDPNLRRLGVDLLRVHHRRCGHDDECVGVVQAEQVIRLEEQDNQISSCADIPACQRVRLLEICFERPEEMCLRYTRSPFSHIDSVTVPVSTKFSSPRKTIQTFPFNASNLVHQGLIRTSARSCMCKVFGDVRYQSIKSKDSSDSWLQSLLSDYARHPDLEASPSQ